MKPKSFNPNSEENVLIFYEKQFLELCAMLESSGIQNPNKKTVLDVYSRLSFFKKKNTHKPSS